LRTYVARGEAPLAPETRQVVVATVNGRAYYDLLGMLRSLGVEFVSRFPWAVKPDETLLLLTTRSELPPDYAGDFILYEELTGDWLRDAVAILGRLLKKRKDTLVVGLDPGENTGVAFVYRGHPVVTQSFRNMDEVLTIVGRALALGVKELLVRIGTGDPSRAWFLARRVADMSGAGVKIEMVDEKGTTKLAIQAGSDHGRRDAYSALMIARKKGRAFARG
jgi:hypothetical protein